MPGHGVVTVLDNGVVGSVRSLFKMAKASGFNGSESAFASRIAKGIRSFEELIKPVDQVIAKRHRDAYKKRRSNPEFLAALAAVNARRLK